MKAAVLRGPRSLVIEDTAEPSIGPGDVLVRVSRAGLCGTDYRIWTGDRPVSYPLVLGHEFVGQVERVGSSVTRVRVGDRVAVEPNYSCGRCPLCREGNRNLCLSRTAVGIDVDGGFAEVAQLPERCCWPLQVAIEDEDVVLVEPLAVVVRAVKRAAPQAGETAAVVGAGTLGLLALQLLRRHGVRVIVTGRTTRRFDLARELGADETCRVGETSLDDTARRFSGREGIDLVVETAGTAEAVSQALALVRPGGRVVLTGLPHEPTPVAFFSVVRREVTILGSMIYRDEFPEALRLIESRAVRTRPLLTHQFPLVAIDAAFTAHRDPTSIKVAVVV